MSEFMIFISAHWGKLLGWAILLLGTLVAAVRYLIKLGVEHYLDRAKKRYEAELEDISFAYRTRFSQLHVEQAAILKELHKRLIALRGFLYDIGSNNVTEQREAVFMRFMGAHVELAQYIKEHRIFITRALSERIDALVWHFTELAHDYSDTSVWQGGGIRAVAFVEHLRKGTQAAESGLAEVEDAFRALLGSVPASEENSKLLK